jgi:putative inorganic carbon (hco3(-)) transporter
MRDVALIGLLLSLVSLALYRPWMGVLGLAVLALMQPQSYAESFMRGFPMYFVLFFVVCVSTAWQQLRSKAWPRLFWDWRLAVFASLWVWFLITTTQAINHWVAWPRLIEVAKLLPPLLLTLWLIDTREKLFYLLATIAISISGVILKGGFWALITGFHDRVYGPPGSQIGGNNEFAVAITMTLPLLVLWLRQTSDKRRSWLIMAVIAFGYAAALSSWSRGGLLALAAVTLLLLWHSDHKLMAIPVLVGGLAVVFYGMPSQWLGRMETISTYQSDASAQSRIEVWGLGLKFIREHLLAGGGFEGWIFISLPTGGLMDWHNAYVEIASEHGLVGLVLWGLLLFGSMASLTRLVWLGRVRRDSWLVDHGAMLRASLVAYAIGAVSLGIAYWEFLYLLIVGAMLVSRFAREEVVAPESARSTI